MVVFLLSLYGYSFAVVRLLGVTFYYGLMQIELKVLFTLHVQFDMMVYLKLLLFVKFSTWISIRLTLIMEVMEVKMRVLLIRYSLFVML